MSEPQLGMLRCTFSYMLGNFSSDPYKLLIHFLHLNHFHITADLDM